jgi:hypothetical protein
MESSPQLGLLRRNLAAAACRHRLFLGLAAIVGLVAPCMLAERFACGQDDWDARPKAAQPGVGQGNVVAMPQRDFDQWVFGGMNRAQVEQRLDSQLAMQVDAAATACGLSDAQQTKLRLAGRADIKEYFDTVERAREKFRDVGQDQQKLQQMWQEIAPLQTKARVAFFDDTSLLQKALKRTLDDRQSALYEQQERERRKFRYEAKIELVVAMLESRMPFRAEQRQKFTKLLLDETKPPQKFGQQDYYVVLYQAGKLDEQKLKSIFDETQWKPLKQALDQARQMERFLKSNGFVP